MLSPTDYGVSLQQGFLSDKPPLKAFPNTYFAPWDNLISRLPDLIRSYEIEDAIKDLPLLDASQLPSDYDFQRAYTILAFLIHGYVWSTSPPRHVIPPQLSDPFLQVCERLGMRPVISYAGLCIWNWTLDVSAAQPTELDNMDMVASFTGTRGEAAFYHVPVMAEYVGGHLVGTLLDAARSISGVTVDAPKHVVAALEDATRTIVDMGGQLPKLYPVLDAEFFYHELRPFITGSKDLPRGMVFQKSNGAEMETRYVGGSVIQSSLFPFLDHMLGVEHGDGMFADMRQYMPGSHRDFLAQIEKLPTLRSYVEAHPQDTELTEAYNECMKALRAWRKKHIAVVSKYIVQPARREMEKAASMSRERKDSPMEGSDAELQGTGGTALIPFLKRTVEDTADVV